MIAYKENGVKSIISNYTSKNIHKFMYARDYFADQYYSYDEVKNIVYWDTWVA